MVTREGVRSRHLAVVAFVVGGLAFVLLRLLEGTGSAVPPPGWAAVLLLVFMAVGVYFAGLPVKRMRSGRPSPKIGPLRAARTLVLAQAAALTGAALIGWYAAQVLLLVPDLDVESQRGRLVPLAAVLVASALLVVSGLLVQRMCRLDEDQRDQRDDEDDDVGV
ncbi:MAG: DUF3180 domain-containing protein [Dermatophilaceae bacterium]